MTATEHQGPQFSLLTTKCYETKHGLLPPAAQCNAAEAGLDPSLRPILTRLFRAVERLFLMGPDTVHIQSLLEAYRLTVEQLARRQP